MPLYPQVVSWPRVVALTYTAVPQTSSTWTSTIVSPAPVAAVLGGYNQSPGTAAVKDLTFIVPMRAGTWTVTMRYTTGPNMGNATIVVDGEESTTIDTYAGSYVTGSATRTFTVATSGDKAVTIRQKGTKNGSAVEYIILWSALDGAMV